MEAATKDAPEPEADVPEQEIGAGKIIDARDGPCSLVTKLAAAMAEAAEVTKDSRNTEQNYSYASVEGILKAVRGPVLERGIVLLQQPVDVQEAEITSSRGTKGALVTVKLDFTFIDGETGETYTIAGWAGQGQDYGDKAYGKAYTNAVKTFIRAQWLLPTGDDPEQDSHAEGRGSRNGGSPAWAKPASKAQKGALIKALDVAIGDRQVAIDYAKLLADSIDGGIPAIVAEWLAALPAWVKPGHAIAEAADAAAQEASGEPETDQRGPIARMPERAMAEAEARLVDPDAEADAALEAAEEVGVETADVDPLDAAHDEIAHQAEAPAAQLGPKPGTVDPPELPDDLDAGERATRLRAAGCICTDPDKPSNDLCPMTDHGIAF